MDALRIRGLTGGVLFLSGELDLASVGTFTEGVKSCIDGEGEVVLDLAGVSFIDSTGVGAVLTLARSLGDRGVIVRDPSRIVRKVFDVVRVEDHANVRVEPSTS